MVDNPSSLVKKITNNHKKNFNVLEIEILFYTMTNIMIIFHFNDYNVEKPHFESRFKYIFLKMHLLA
jgi:hypothetical protein